MTQWTDGDAAPWQILNVDLFQLFPLTPVEFGPETKAIAYFMKLVFHLYVDRRKRSPYASRAPVLLQVGPEGWGKLELELDWASVLS
jgi:hypothetical protein